MSNTPQEYIAGVIALAQTNTGSMNPNQLAKHLGVSQGAVSTWQRGVSYPSGQAAIALATAAGLSPGAFLLWSLAQQHGQRFPDAADWALAHLKSTTKKSALSPRGIKVSPW